MASTPVFEPGPHWWEASALTTAPSLAPLLSAIRSAHVLPPFILSPKKRRQLLRLLGFVTRILLFSVNFLLKLLLSAFNHGQNALL